MEDKTDYGYVKALAGIDYDDAIVRVTEALKSEGFGILTEIDIRETFQKKIDVEFRPYMILGACNPHLAHKALGVDPQMGLLLPCNVVVQKTDDGSLVSIADPRAMSELTGNPGLDEIVADADARIRRVMEVL